jgi:DNA-binding response OmpR family regulator
MKKILLIEDDSFLSEIYTAKFEESGFEVLIAHDGAVGLGKAREEAPDMILLDVVMPNMDGFEVLHAVKEDPSAKDIPVVILSNLGEQENVTKGLELGAAAYIVKAHYTPTEVVAKVQEILSK